jgi:hypothetical protein
MAEFMDLFHLNWQGNRIRNVNSFQYKHIKINLVKKNSTNVCAV